MFGERQCAVLSLLALTAAWAGIHPEKRAYFSRVETRRGLKQGPKVGGKDGSCTLTLFAYWFGIKVLISGNISSKFRLKWYCWGQQKRWGEEEEGWAAHKRQPLSLTRCSVNSLLGPLAQRGVQGCTKINQQLTRHQHRSRSSSPGLAGSRGGVGGVTEEFIPEIRAQSLRWNSTWARTFACAALWNVSEGSERVTLAFVWDPWLFRVGGG